MKVALVLAHLSRLSGGLAHSVSGLAQHLAHRGVEALILGVRDPKAPEDVGSWGACAVACRSIGPRSFAWAPSMLSVLRRFGPDVADTQHLWMYPSVCVSRWATAESKPYVVTPRGMLDPIALQRASWKKRMALAFFEGDHLRGAQCIRALANAEYVAIRAFGLRNPVAIVPNGIDLCEIVMDFSNRLVHTLVFFGRIDRKKGVHELVRGWGLSGAEVCGWRLRIVGWGEERYVAATRRLVAELGLERSVELVGPAFGEAKERAFREADAFILPSYSEGLPMAVLEAWSYALPVLMTRACNLPEGFDRGAAIEIGTEPERIAEGIRILVGMSDTERKAMGVAGRKLVEDRFTWPKVADQMLAVYEWVLGGGPPPCCVVTD